MDFSVSELHFFNLQSELILNNKIEEFNNLTDHASKIKFMFSVCQSDEYHLTKFELKRYKSTKLLEVEADQLFRQKRNSEALAAYNKAIKICPQNDKKGKQLYAILLEKRSTVFFVLRKYQNGLNDIAYLKQFGHHPNPEKLNSREAKAITVLQKSVQSKDVDCEESNWCSENTTYPALSNKLTIKQDKVLGRYVVATEDIKPGEIMAIEKPYASVITDDISCLICRYCAASTNQVYACPKCQEVYCSMLCLEKAKVYHQYECALLPFFENDNSLLLAFRMVIQRPLKQILEDEAIAKTNKNIDIYKTNDYYNVSRLVKHKDENTMMHRIYTAVFLLKLLRTTTYFCSKARNAHLSKNEVLVGELFITYMLILNSNAHSITKWEIAEMEDNATAVGGALYPTLSLFNHSCDPSVRRYNIKNVMVARSVKPIKAGDIVNDTYGATYGSNAKFERDINNLNYKFTCRCQACRENWPTLDNMQPGVLRVRCNCGTNWKIIHSEPSFFCSKCQIIKPILRDVEPMQLMIKNAENMFAGGHYEDAKKLYAQIIDLQFKIFVPPMRDIVTMQERLLSCYRRTASGTN